MSDLDLFFIGPVMIWDWIYPGWNRRRRGHLEPISGWRFVLHRILWGFERLVHIEPADTWVLPDYTYAGTGVTA